MNRTLLILAGALVVAGIALFYVYAAAYISEATGGPRVQVVAAGQDIPFGRPVELSWLTAKEIPINYAEERHIRLSELRSLVGVPLAQSVRGGEAILRTDLSTLSDRQRTLSGDVPPGKRALAIAAQPESSFAGLLRPGDRVDVLLTVGDVRQRGSSQAVVVAQNLLVLAVGRHVTWNVERAGSPSEQQRTEWTTQISLEVGLEDAGRITLAQQQGRLRTLLRNPNDASVIEGFPPVTDGALFDFAQRQGWLRRFALVERPALALPPDALSPETLPPQVVPDAPAPPPTATP
ncbi:MAG: Flp pilus assembly protein CpaB [Sandaracinaceae bacterium]|nr:Flp pilus assembly protein CpaB [Sandaracinaceae bacterium]